MSVVVERPSFLFRSPTVIQIAGPSSSGKSTLLYYLLRHNRKLFQHPPAGVVYCYAVQQPLYEKMERDVRPRIHFHRGVPTEEDVLRWREEFSGAPFVLVLDDLMQETRNSDDVEKMFTRLSHHANMTVINLTQNLFYRGEINRTASLNSHYVLLLRNMRDKRQVRTLASQIAPGQVPSFMSVYEDALRMEPGETVIPPYLLVDVHPFVDKNQQLFARILPRQAPIVNYHLPAL